MDLKRVPKPVPNRAFYSSEASGLQLLAPRVPGRGSDLKNYTKSVRNGPQNQQNGILDPELDSAPARSVIKKEPGLGSFSLVQGRFRPNAHVILAWAY